MHASVIIENLPAALVENRMFALPNPLSSHRSHNAALRRLLACLAILLAAVSIGGCNLLPEVKDAYANLTAEQLYRQAKDAMSEGNYTKAIKLYEALEARFPYGRFAQQAILEGAYANYRIGETATAIAACDRFIRTYPNHPSVDYAYYLKGLVYFREDQGLIGYVYELDLSEREQKSMRESFLAFKDLVAKFPDSKYAQDSLERMRYLSNSLALYDVKVARYYYNRGAYVAAVLVVDVPWRGVAYSTLVPSFSWQKDYIVAIVAVLGTTISPYLFFWQSSQEAEDELRKAVNDCRLLRNPAPCR